MAELATLLDALAAEGHVVDRLLADLPDSGWAAPTPAAGWTVAHQIAHLAWTDHQALLAVTDPPGFAAQMAELLAADPLGFVDTGARDWARTDPAPLRTRWRQGRADLAAALAALPPGARVTWYGPPMSAASMATARIMETWAHGYDLADALGVVPEPTHRLRHVAHLGVRTRDFAFHVHGLDAPTEEFAVELTAPDGQPWRWGPDAAAQRVTGPALDFCLLVTQRRHRADLAGAAVGVDADRWLDVAQAFAGPPGGGRAPGRVTGGAR
ncbi:TIGR03084 family metal-binding protein [Catellatospora tritici]|uniref:TIGR03084 family metal-binding protein n=1 Tax=Catellatospora tritici TaxID=2851566 RepID=UPI001C2D66B2|nr:TIGR03084 family metal-binding protein [Catellatospora tritici]MBV1856238.1 TIGR03084 family protein [Catellatospora tritici]